MLCRTSLVCNNDWEKPTANDWILKVTECSRRDNKHNEKMSRRMHPSVHFSVPLLWQKYFRASSSTYVGMRCKNKPSTHNFPCFFSNPLLLCTSKKRECFGVSSYSHSLPKINEFFTIARILFMVIFKKVRIAILLALMSFFFLVFPYSAAIFKPCVLWGHAKVEANDLQLLPPATFILYSHLFKNTGEQKEITERQATCWGGDWKRAWEQCRHCWRWGRAAPAPAAPGNTCRGAGAAQSQGPHGPGSAAASHCLLPS